MPAIDKVALQVERKLESFVQSTTYIAYCWDITLCAAAWLDPGIGVKIAADYNRIRDSYELSCQFLGGAAIVNVVCKYGISVEIS